MITKLVSRLLSGDNLLERWFVIILFEKTQAVSFILVGYPYTSKAYEILFGTDI